MTVSTAIAILFTNNVSFWTYLNILKIFPKIFGVDMRTAHEYNFWKDVFIRKERTSNNTNFKFSAPRRTKSCGDLPRSLDRDFDAIDSMSKVFTLIKTKTRT